MRMGALGLAILLVGLTACGGKPVTPSVPLRPELAGFQRQITTKSVEAQQYFDQGITLYFGFNHDAAVASFAQAAAFDPKCAMAHWGQAISLGPNINNPAMDDSASKRAWDALQKAVALSASASPVEKDLITALATRYSWPAPDNRAALDSAYANAMRGVWQQHGDDVDVGALYAEALMDLRPWDLWSPAGEAQPETPEIIATLETILARVPDHPGATHFYIHTMEASPTPEKALPAANQLRARIPGAGHLVHMPAHIDIRLGHYNDAIVANQKATVADGTWATEQGGFYTLYRAHNYHFLAYAAMFDGQREVALEASREMLERLSLDTVRQYIDFLEGFVAVPIHVHARFGMWEELLAMPAPPADLLVTTAFWHYGRTVAAASLGRVDEAAASLAAFQQAYAAVPESRLIGNNAARTVLEVGLPMAEGELEYRRGNYDRAFELLRTAVRRDVALKYDEPWGWMMPVSHALGALLLEQGRVEEAEAVYRDDLRLHPDNGWALHGLAECLRRSGRAAEATDADARFRGAWTRSDIAIKGSCFCRTKS